MTVPSPEAQGGAPGESANLRRIAKLERINAALMAHVERSMDQQGGAYSLFQTATMLEGRVRSRTEELPSEALVRGAIQVPPDGRPIVFGADHPVTGGYPVLAVVLDSCLDAAAQAQPGARIRFSLARVQRGTAEGRG